MLVAQAFVDLKRLEIPALGGLKIALLLSDDA